MPTAQPLKLSELITAVRKCKTAAEERAVIAKECALIRTYIKEKQTTYRARNVVKLMYIHMLGHPTQFGQMECIQLIISDKFVDKRIGYLALMVLLDETSEVLTMIENRLILDMGNADNQFIPGLALCTVANISSEEMARGVSPKILEMLSAHNPYLRKKAALCALRVVRKVGQVDVIDLYMEHYAKNSPFTERNHGVLVSVLALLNHVLGLPDGQKFLPQFREFVNHAIRTLKNLVVPSYATEHDVNGVVDPFLQVKLLHFLRIVGKDDVTTSEKMKDILSDVITSTEHNKSVGNSVLYECVLTIVNVESDSQLRLMAVNILGQFLINRDNNIRYVALHTLTQVVKHNVQAVQQHKDTIVDCLRDLDVSIRRRALDLIYALVNPQNIRLLVPDLINFLSVAPQDLKQDITTKICSVVERYGPTPQWHVDTLIKVLTLAGSFVPEKVGHKLIGLISNSATALQSYCVKAFWSVMRSNAPTANGYTQTVEGNEEAAMEYCKKVTLISASVWCIGEYADLLITDSKEDLASEDVSLKDWKRHKPTSREVLTVLTSLLNSHFVTNIKVKQQTLMALFKLAAKSPDIQSQVKEVLAQFNQSKDIELQQRAVEFSTLLQNLSECPGLMDRMPAIPPMDSTLSDAPLSPDTKLAENITQQSSSPTTPTPPQQQPPPPPENKPPPPPLKDDFDMFFDEPTSNNSPDSSTQLQPQPDQPLPPKKDVFDDLFGT